MKKVMIVCMSLAIVVAITASCNMSDKKDTPIQTTTVGTDSSMMHSNENIGTATNSAGDTTAIQKDAAAMNADKAAAMKKMDTATTKPNPDKKGKKGKISIPMMEQAANANTEMMDKEGYYTNIYPSYDGGQNALAKFFENNIQYPQDATDNGIEGTVNISFAVDEKGKISSAKTTNPTIGYGIEEEALRVFKKMPTWKPGALKGKNVKTKYNLPVRFQLG
jgi:periplasmic protein TonB